jgi:hypothetical protein
MSGLLEEVLSAYGGLQRWRAVTAFTAKGGFGGLLRSRFPGNRMANVTARVELAERRAVFSPEIHTHSARQTFYVDAAGLIRRHDYVAEPIGRWARAAHYCDDHRDFAALVFPTRRRVRPRGPGGRSLPKPILVSLDIDHIEIEKCPQSRETSHEVRSQAASVRGGGNARCSS